MAIKSADDAKIQAHKLRDLAQLFKVNCLSKY